ncbi:hypothetical protein G6F43_010104 [Rhizopus delemar]|nr:hypothetical protein G6F43_010104 [Rhizopus delemar]
MSLDTFTTPLDHASFAISSLYNCVPIAATQHQLQAYEKFISKCNKSQERVETALRYFLYPALIPNSEPGFEIENDLTTEMLVKKVVRDEGFTTIALQCRGFDSSIYGIVVNNDVCEASEQNIIKQNDGCNLKLIMVLDGGNTCSSHHYLRKNLFHDGPKTVYLACKDSPEMRWYSYIHLFPDEIRYCDYLDALEPHAFEAIFTGSTHQTMMNDVYIWNKGVASHLLRWVLGNTTCHYEYACYGYDENTSLMDDVFSETPLYELFSPESSGYSVMPLFDINVTPSSQLLKRRNVPIKVEIDAISRSPSIDDVYDPHARVNKRKISHSSAQGQNVRRFIKVFNHQEKLSFPCEFESTQPLILEQEEYEEQEEYQDEKELEEDSTDSFSLIASIETVENEYTLTIRNALDKLKNHIENIMG